MLSKPDPDRSRPSIWIKSGQEATNDMGATLELVEPRLRREGATRRLVIVADSSLIIEAIRIGFRGSDDFTLVGHANPRRTPARTILEAKPDVVLLDDSDQSERALQLTRLLRSEDEEVAVVVLSLRLDAGWLDELFGAGAVAVISKATRPATLATLVRETLDGHVVHPRPSEPSDSPTVAAAGSPLTNREREILHLVASGSSNADVAERLWVTEQTVKFHLRNIYRKLEIANRTQAGGLAHVSGLVHHGSVASVASVAGVAYRPELKLA